MPELPNQKNTVYGVIHAGGDVHIGGVIYHIERDFKAGSILFLRLGKKHDMRYEARLSVKSRHSTLGTLATSGETWCENIAVDIPADLFDRVSEFQDFRRKTDAQIRHKSIGEQGNQGIQALEDALGQLIFQTFFGGIIGKACADFIQLLEEQRLDELLLAVSTDDETIINLPFEMALPLLFPLKMGVAKKSLAAGNFGLVRTKIASLEAFNMQGDHATAAPLKMLFITALPENLDERGKMLQIEEEQTRLIQAIGQLEATGDKTPKIVIEFLENASLEELDKALKARQHDILHISGHGAYHAAQNKGVLYFENEHGDEEQISGAALGETLRQHACVKLLILSACETAIAGREGGVTEQAADFGVPGIVAMRFAVTDEGAKVFTTEFYTHLAKGLSLTRALAYAREALHRDIVQRREQAPQILHMAEWFTPVVYQNQALGPLIDKTQPYHLPGNFYPQSSFLKTKNSRLIGEGFIGRKRYLIRMRQAFRAGRHVCLHGLGGLGKTTLAEAFAHNYDNHSHTTIFFRNGSQINEAHILQTLNKRFAAAARPDLAEQMQQAMDDPQTEAPDKLQLLIDNYLQGRQTILIFDNAEDVQTDLEGQLEQKIGSAGLRAFLRHLCEKAPRGCHIVFTTRYKIQDLADLTEHIALDKMGYAEQYRLLNYSETLRGIPLQDRDDVYKRLDGHPRGYEYLEALLKKDKTFTWQQVAHSEENVFEDLLLAKVYERLGAREKALFQIVAIFITRTPLAALAAVSGEPEAELLPVLQSLQDWSLCFLEKDGRFEVHRLTREWMRQQETPAEKVKEWALKAGAYFVENAATYEDVELSIAYYEIAEAWDDFVRISHNLQNEYERIGLNQRVLEINQAVLAKNIDDKSNSLALGNIAYLLVKTGNYDEALPIFEQCLELDRKIGDRQGEGVTLNNLATTAHAKGDYDRALRYLEQSLAIQQQIGDRQGEGVTLSNISQIYDAKGDYDTSLRYLEQSLAIQQQIGDRKGEGTTLNNISQIYSAKGDYDTSLRYLEQSLAIQQQIGDRKGESVTLNNIGQIHKVRGNYDEALRYAEMDLAICREIGDRQGEGVTLNNLATTAHAKGDYDRALRYLERSLAIRQQIGDRKGEGATLNNISQIYDAKGDYDTALRYLEQSLAIQQQIGDISGLATTLNNMGAMLFDQERYEEAIPLLMHAYQILQKIGSPNADGTAGYLGAIIERIGEAKFQEIISRAG
jgi:tetratricopeptide (TPR) repeat protein